MKDKPYSAFKKTKTVQLVLFDFMEENDDKHTNSIAVYDLMPKYVWNAPSIKRTPSVDGRFQSLPRLEREFTCGGVECKLVITPARLMTEDKKEVDYYPGEREQIVEMALRRISIKRQRTHLIEEFAGLTFTLHELRKELKEAGHEYSLVQIKQSIEIMHRCNIEVMSSDESIKFSSPIFPVKGIKQKQPDGSEITFVVFNPLVSDAIQKLEFRQLDYVISTSFDSYIARWLHMRMVHFFRQASVTNPYTIRASTIARDCGIPYGRLRDVFRAIRKALDELKARDAVLHMSITQEAGERKNSVADEVYAITPSAKFSNEQKRANAIANRLTERNAAADAKRLEHATEQTRRRRL